MNLISPFTPPHPLKTAVLFIVFNRLDTTIKVFEEIRKAKPPALYIAADGARTNKDGELNIVENVRKYILENIDWDCKVKTLFRKENLGCKYSVSGAISWFFENEEQGIIIEDDCLPMQSFFWFCEEMLNQYKHDTRIMMITGTNYLIDIRNEVQREYIFSRHFSIWGWATWKRSWLTYDVELDSYVGKLKEENDYSYLSLSKHENFFYEGLINHIINKKIDTWDFQWVFNCIYNYGLCVTPSVNLISNLGVVGAHANGRTENNFLTTQDINLKCLKKEKWVIPNMYHDKKVSSRNFKQSIMIRLRVKLRKIFNLFFR
jgi:hypothetical protein